MKYLQTVFLLFLTMLVGCAGLPRKITPTQSTKAQMAGQSEVSTLLTPDPKLNITTRTENTSLTLSYVAAGIVGATGVGLLPAAVIGAGFGAVGLAAGELLSGDKEAVRKVAKADTTGEYREAFIANIRKRNPASTRYTPAAKNGHAYGLVMQFETLDQSIVPGGGGYYFSLTSQARIVDAKSEKIVWRRTCRFPGPKDKKLVTTWDDLTKNSGEKLNKIRKHSIDACAELTSKKFIQDMNL